MLKKPFKTIKSTLSDDSKIYVYGNNHWKELQLYLPEWNKDDVDPNYEDCFLYKCELYFPSQFMRIDERSPFYLLDKDGNTLFDGYHNDSFFSGILVKYSECGSMIKVYTYIS